MKEIFLDIVFIVGKNAQDNWNMLSICQKQKFGSEFIWFHLDKKPSTHVIMCETIKNLKKKTKRTGINYRVYLNHGKFLLLSNSKWSGKVIYTQIRNVTKSKKIGSVITKKINYI